MRDYVGLLHLAGDYTVIELYVEPEDWIADRTLAELNLFDEGVLVLGIEKADGTYVGAPRGSTQVATGDTLVIYGRQETLVNLDVRRTGSQGNWEHHKAISQQLAVEAEESEVESPAETE